jgi:hypothetical protein
MPMPAHLSTQSWTEIAAFLSGGPFGITASMWAHPRLARILKRSK